MFQKTRMLWAFYQIIKDPTKTEKVLLVGNNKSMVSKKSLAVPLQRIEKDYKSAQFLRSRWTPRKYEISDLLKLDSKSFGFLHACHMMNNDLDPEFFGKLAGDDDVTYIRKRARQTHDFFHTLTGFDTSTMGEAGVIAFTFAQFGGPFLLVILALLLLHFAFYHPGKGPQCFESIVKGYKMGRKANFLFPIKFEELFHINLESLRKELGIKGVLVEEESPKINYQKYPSLPFQSDLGPEVKFWEPADQKESNPQPSK